MMNIYGEYFYENKISDYGLEHGFVDYRTLAKAFDAVLNNDIMHKTAEIGYWDIYSGTEMTEDEDFKEFFQFYIVSEQGAEILSEAGETVWYNDALDMYVWGVDHWGTSWDYVLTNVPCNTGKTE